MHKLIKVNTYVLQANLIKRLLEISFVLNKLEQENKFAIMDNGKPTAIMFKVPNIKSSFDKTVGIIKRLKALGRIVNGYLDFAEEYAKQQIPLTMADWAKHLDLILQANGKKLLQNAGKITAELAKQHAENEFDKYRPVQDKLFESDFDRVMRLKLS